MLQSFIVKLSFSFILNGAAQKTAHRYIFYSCSLQGQSQLLFRWEAGYILDRSADHHRSRLAKEWAFNLLGYNPKVTQPVLYNGLFICNATYICIYILLCTFLQGCFSDAVIFLTIHCGLANVPCSFQRERFSKCGKASQTGTLNATLFNIFPKARCESHSSFQNRVERRPRIAEAVVAADETHGQSDKTEKFKCDADSSNISCWLDLFFLNCMHFIGFKMPSQLSTNYNI